MQSTPMTRQDKTFQVGFSLDSMTIANPANAAENATGNALRFASERLGVEDAAALVRAGDARATSYWQFALAKEVATYLGALDADVQAIFLAEYDATPEDVCFSEIRPASPIHLIVLVKRKTAALNALINGIDRALIESCRQCLNLDQLAHVLDVQVVDEVDVDQRVGYGALLSSIHHKPIQIWSR